MATLHLEADTSIGNLHEVWPKVRAFVEGADAAMEIDAAAVQRPDTALVQMLAMAVLRSRECGKQFKLLNATPQLIEQIRILALGIVLDE